MSANRRLAQLWLDARTTNLWASADTIDSYTDDLNCYLQRVLLPQGQGGRDEHMPYVDLPEACDVQ